MSYYLLTHKNPHGPHYYTSRRDPLRVIVVHITAGLEDLDFTDDQSAENTARYAATTDRKVSWHSGSDTDTALALLPETYTAFHCQGYNSESYGHEISKKTTDWSTANSEWVTRTLRQAASILGPVAARNNIPLRRLSRAQVDAGLSGFAAHADLDPARRSDPGRDFPWQRFFAAFTSSTGEFRMDAEAKARFDAIDKTLSLLFSGDSDRQTAGDQNPAHVGLNELSAKVNQVAADVAEIKRRIATA